MSWIRQLILNDEQLELKKLGSSSNSLIIHSFIFPAHNSSFSVNILIDSGCSAFGFIDYFFVQTHALQKTILPKARTVVLADGVTTEPVIHYVLLPITIGHHHETALFFVTKLSQSTPVILGIPWLQRHNPVIDWPSLSLVFSSWFCGRHCFPRDTPYKLMTAPTVSSDTCALQHLTAQPPKKVHFDNSNYKALSIEDFAEESIKQSPPTNYKRAAVEDIPDEAHTPTPHTAPELEIEQTLTPGQPHYRIHDKHAGQGPERRAIMIPNYITRKPQPTTIVAGSRRRMPPPPKSVLPSLSVPIPEKAIQQPEHTRKPPLKAADVKYLGAASFVQYCKGAGVTCQVITMDDLQRASQPPPETRDLPDLSEDEFRAILHGQGDLTNLHTTFGNAFHDFLTECIHPLQLNKLTEADIDKFLVGKPELTQHELLSKLPAWLHDLQETFYPKLADQLPPRRSWDHKIELKPGTEPPYFKNRPLSQRELQVVYKWINENLNKGFIRASRSRSAAPLMLAQKPGGGVRICQDYRGLNNVTIKNRYPLPLIRETLDALCHAKVYTKLDIIAAFNKLRIAEGHEWKTAFITRFGLYESLVMPFGLCNAPASFQHYINHQLHDLLDKYCTAYLDDVLVYSKNKKEHREHVREVVKRLRDAGLQIDIHKCEFETTRTKYLGLIITPDGIEMDDDKVTAIQGWEPPDNVRDLQRFLGFANFYRRFIQGYSTVCIPLNELLRKDIHWKWGRPQQQAFRTLKDAFSTAPTLAYFDYNKEAILETDASNWASGGVLSQKDDEGILRPVAYFSSKHTPAECNYEIYDKELLAIVKCLEEWRPELQGTAVAFDIMTDHKNLEYFQTTKVLNQRQVRWSEFLSQFNFRIVYRPGPKAIRPDALSRKAEDRPNKSDTTDERFKHRERVLLPPEKFDPQLMEELLNDANNGATMRASPIDLLIPDVEKPIDELIKAAYERSDTAQAMITCLGDPANKHWPKSIRKQLKISMVECKVVEGLIYWRERLFIPPDDEVRTQILYRTHSSGPGGHPGRVKTIELVSRTYWWPRMTLDIAEYVKACELCIRVKSSRLAPPGFLQPLPVPFQAWSDISVDYITPFPICERNGVKYKHILVVVCRLTKMRHFIPVASLSTEELVNVFVSRVYALHGCPKNIVSDRGTQFVSEFWRQLSKRLGITLCPSSAYHPQTDGQTERLNAILETYLRAFMNFQQNDWVDWLPLAEFASNNAVSETTGVSPFFANYGFNPYIGVEPPTPLPPNFTAAQKQQFYRGNAVAKRFERILTQLTALAKQSQQRYEDNANVHRSAAPRYQVGDLVYVATRNMKTNRPMKKGDDKWAGPYEVLEVYPSACKVKLPDGVRIYPVFHNQLLRHKPNSAGLPHQDKINETETRHLRGRVLEREDGVVEVNERYEFDTLLDSDRKGADNGLRYLIQWKHQAATWEPASNLMGQDEAIRRFHATFLDKPGPPAWVKITRTQPNVVVATPAAAAIPAPLPKRGPGRPPKAKQPAAAEPELPVKRKRGRPRKDTATSKDNAASILLTPGKSRIERLSRLGMVPRVSFAVTRHAWR